MRDLVWPAFTCAPPDQDLHCGLSNHKVNGDMPEKWQRTLPGVKEVYSIKEFQYGKTLTHIHKNDSFIKRADHFLRRPSGVGCAFFWIFYLHWQTKLLADYFSCGRVYPPITHHPPLSSHVHFRCAIKWRLSSMQSDGACSRSMSVFMKLAGNTTTVLTTLHLQYIEKRNSWNGITWAYLFASGVSLAIDPVHEPKFLLLFTFFLLLLL